MTSVMFSVFLLLQTASPLVPGRVSVEGGAQLPSSFTLPLTPVGAPPASILPPTPLTRGAAAPSLTIRVHLDGTFRVTLPAGEFRVGTPERLPPGYALQSITYGGVDLLRNPLKMSSDGSAEMVINLTLNGPSPAVSVSGRVTGLEPGQIKRISLRESYGGELTAALETSVGPDGAFTFPKVLPGTYLVYMRLLTRAQVTVGNTDVTGLVVAHPQDILTSGHVILEGPQTPIPAINVEGNGKAATLQNGASGTFILSLVKGDNSISVRNIPEAYRLKSITYGDTDLQKEPLKLDGPAVWDIIVRLAPKN